MPYRRTLSTGVIKKDVANVDAHIEIVNLTSRTIEICVLAFNWDANPSTALPVVPGNPFVIPANSNQPFDVSLKCVTNQYEIRLSIPAGDVIANVFALNSENKVVAGNTVLFEDLIPTSPYLVDCCLKKEPWLEED